MNIVKMKYLFFLCLAFCLISCGKENKSVLVSLHQLQVPVLKFKKDNPVLRIKMVLPESETSSLVESFQVNLTGTDNLEDIKHVRLYYLGTDSLLTNTSQLVQFGQDMSPEKDLSFKGKQKLKTGDNYFWISCELTETASLSHKIDAGCTKISFSNNTFVKPQIFNPPVKQRIGVAVRQHMQDEVHTYRIPGIATTNNGTLLAIYDVRRLSSRDLQGDIDIGLSRSTDGGNSWESMRIALDMKEWGGLPQKFNGVSDACILVDKNSANIFIAGLWMHGVLDENGTWIQGLTEKSETWEHQWRRKGSQPGFGVKQTCQFLIAKSMDDGKTWSEPVNITRMGKKPEWWLYAPAPGHGITLDDGTLVFPTQGRGADDKTFSNITYSQDGGKTWVSSSPAFHNTTENMAVQLTNGDIMLNMRDNRNRSNKSATNGRAIAVSKDLGKTWTEHPTSHSALIESTCMASLHKHVYTKNGQKKHILLFSNPNTKSGRFHTTIKVSFDDGETWPQKYWYLLDEGKNRGYSCLTSIDENTIGILYEGSQADMTFESIPIGELLGNR